MDFQLARNLSALARAQQETAQALLHIDTLSDCINREIIMSAASSEANEQLLASAKATLLQVQNTLATQSDEGASRLRDAQSLSSQRDGCALPVHQRPMSLRLIARCLKFTCLEGRVALLKESHLVMATPLHRPPFVAAYGVMMSRDDGERASI